VCREANHQSAGFEGREAAPPKRIFIPSSSKHGSRAIRFHCGESDAMPTLFAAMTPSFTSFRKTNN
jgi:hypothetical protein